MKNIYKKIIALASSSLVVGAVVLTNLSSAAGTATLAFSTSTATAVKDSNISVTITANSGSSAMNVVTSDFSYDSTKLEFVSISSSDSAYGIEAEGSGGGGSVAITRAVLNGGTLTGANKVASVNFKVLGSSGTTDLNFTATSVIVASGSDIWNGEPSTMTLTLSAPAVANPATPADDTEATPDPNTPDSGTPKSKPSPNSAVVTSGQNIPDDMPVPVTNSGSAVTDGYIVTVQVFDKTGLGIPKVEVKLGDKTETTDNLGIASFNNVVAGEYTISSEGSSKKITVVDANKTESQNFSLTASDKNLFKTIIIIVAGIAGALIIIGVVIRLIRNMRNPRDPSGGATVGTAVRPEDMHRGIFDDKKVESTVTSPGTTLVPGSASESEEVILARLKGVNAPPPSEVIMPTSNDNDQTI